MRLIGLIIILNIIPLYSLAQTEREGESHLSSYQIDMLYDKGINLLASDSFKSYVLINDGILQASINGDKYRETQGIIYLIAHNVHYGSNQEAIDMALQVLQARIEVSKKDSMLLVGRLSTALANIGAYNLAIKYRRMLIKIHGKPTIQEAYYQNAGIALMFSKFEKFDSANYYYEVAHKIAKETNDRKILMHYYNNTAHNYMLQNDFNQSKKHFNLVLGLFESNAFKNTKDSILYGVALSNLGRLYSINNKHTIAINYTIHSNQILSRTYPTILPESHITLGRNYISLGKKSLAKVHFEKAEADLLRDKDILYYYEELSKYYKATKQYNLAISTLEKYVDKQTALLESKTKNTQVNELITYQENRIKRELVLLQIIKRNEAKKHSLKIKMIVIISFLAISLGALLFIKYKSDIKKKATLKDLKIKLNEERVKLQEVEQKKLRTELFYKNKDLADFAIDITRKHEFLETILVKLKELQRSNENTPLMITKVVQYVKSQLHIGRNLKLFQENVDKVNSEFINVLGQKYPDLTINELQICALLRLELSTKEIATIKNIEIDSVKTMRYRLRKKLSITAGTNLILFLKKL